MISYLAVIGQRKKSGKLQVQEKTEKILFSPEEY